MLTSRESDYNEATKEDFHCFDWFCIHTLPIISPKWRDISVQKTKRMSEAVTATDAAYAIFVLETNKLYWFNEIEKEMKTPANEAGDETEEGRNADGIVEVPYALHHRLVMIYSRKFVTKFVHFMKMNTAMDRRKLIKTVKVKPLHCLNKKIVQKINKFDV